MQDNRLPTLPLAQQSSATDQVFDALYTAVVSLDLPPGSKVSEAEIAKQLGVSRQPVRDAFFRLSKLGFLQIRPQRATLISKITISAVLEAMFIRNALELACLEDAMKHMDAEGLSNLQDLINQQIESPAPADSIHFQELDDAFHRTLAEIGGNGYVWPLIQDHKGQMDRVRYLSLVEGKQLALDEHVQLFAAIQKNDIDTAREVLQKHLCRIATYINDIRNLHPDYFEETSQ